MEEKNLQKVTSYKTKYQLAYETLREAIINGSLRPGQSLVVTELAEQMGLSRMPIREAMKRLEAEGFVTVTPHKVAVVTGLSPEDVAEVFIIRESLEGMAARLASQRITPENLASLRERVAQMEAEMRSGDYPMYGRLNRGFHRYICHLSGNKRLVSLLNEIWDANDRFRALFVMVPRRVAASLDEHQEILEVLAAREPDRAEEIMRRHVRLAGQSLLAQVQAGANQQLEAN